MNKPFQNQNFKRFIQAIKPWFTGILLVLILQYTGLLSSISAVSQSAILETGFLDAEPEETSGQATFNYDFKIRDLNGNVTDMSQLKGKVIFLNLWATWCGPCRVEMPSIQNLYNSINTDQIVFVMLSIDDLENKNKVVKYIADKGFNFPVYVPEGYLTRQLKVPSIPTTFVIGKNGKIKSKNVGVANYDTPEFKKFLEDLAAE